MALDALKGFFDNTLEAVFNRKEEKPETLRAPLLKGIEGAKKQFENGSTKAPNRWWKVSNGVVALTVKVKGDTFAINGVDTNHMPQERFSEFLDKFKGVVESGGFDEELKNHGNGDAKVVIGKTPKATGTRTYSEESKLNIRVGGFRRGGQTDAQIKERLKAEGVADDKIKTALARKPATKP